ncbi:hypothetical protein Taro_021128 [Colocasia esculenta]|uniref:Uncharacterized protein n=1 Tax=Colocasia esculenta TaxID=4460 RepID=A0A843VAK1_COLES|nr:hypothetical protein [Colocasia esculenta]
MSSSLTSTNLRDNGYFNGRISKDDKYKTEEKNEDLVGSRVLFPFGCERRPGGLSRVLLFPSGVKEDQLSWVL